MEDIEVILSTQKGITFEFKPVYLSENHFRDDKHRIFPLFNGASSPDFRKTGQKDYRFKTIPLGLPSFHGNSFKIISIEYEDLPGVTLKTVPNLIKEGGFIVYDYQEDLNNSLADKPNLVEWGEFGIFREIIIGNLKIYPYEQIGNDLVRIYKKIVVEIIYGMIDENVLTKPVQGFLVDGLINKENAKFWFYNSNFNSLSKTHSNLLSTGEWYKIKITEEGIYKLDYNFLRARGIDLSNLDPRTIKIFGNGGRMLSERPEDPKPEGFIENAIVVYGEQDGRFDQNDYILFYAPATSGWEYDAATNSFKHYYHHYSDVNYVWLTFGGNYGKRISPKMSLTSTPDYSELTTNGFIFKRDFKKNLASTGRKWFGDEFNDRTKSRVYTNRLPGLIPNQQITYRIGVAARSDKYTTFSIEESSNIIGNISVLPADIASGSGMYARLGHGVFTFTSNLNDQRSVLKITYNITDPISQGYLDYFEIIYPRYLDADNDRIWFFSPYKTGVVEYTIKNFSSSDINVFDVTDFANIKVVQGAEISGMQIKFKAREESRNPSKYFAVGSNGYLVPSEMVKVPNQSLRDLSLNQGAELIIISPKEFLAEANRLKAHKENLGIAKTTVVNLEEIYNEFSCGVFDITAIRDFIRYAFLNWNVKPLYVLLFGDGHYDYRNVEGYGKNFIPPYETEESLFQIYSYPTDDYYGRIIGNDLIMDISIGRLNIQSIDEAKRIVDKIINYETNRNFGPWRNLITLVADDGRTTTGDDGDIHTRQSEFLSKNRIPSSFDQKKIYLIQYPTIETAGGRRKPDVNKEIINTLNNGTLIINFIGHGNPEVWTHEFVFEKTVTIPQLKNYDRLCFLSAATCDFGDYDKPSSQSSMELLVLSPTGGAIAGFTASRLVWSDQNAAINNSLFQFLLSYKNTNSPQPTIGLAYLNTKKIHYYENDQKYQLFGDPSLYLNAPKLNGTIDSVNSKSTITQVELKSLNNAEIIGTVSDINGNIASDFNGQVIVTVYDSKRYQEIPEWYGWTGSGKGIELAGGIVYRGRASVRNGIFKTEFVVPKDLSYENNNGKITAYFFNESTDGIGFTQNIRLVSADSINIVDNKGPKIEIYFDNEYSPFASLVQKNATLIARLEDETGINTTGLGIGHDLEAILNDNISNSIKLNEYFQGELDQGNKKGEVRYRFLDLPSGKNKLKLTAWDVLNNSNSVEVLFEVVDENKLVIKYVYNYPNPMKSETEFTFQHSYDMPVNVEIKIYSVAGRLLHKIEKHNVLEKFVKIPWDGKDINGDYLGNGVYLYKIILTSVDQNKSSEAIGKLAIVR